MQQSTWQAHRLVIRHSRFSFHLDRRVPVILFITLLITLAVMVINMGVGEFPIAPLDVIRSVLHLTSSNSDYDFIVNTLRLPRMLVAALVGGALALSGTILQGLTRNPLSDPAILGIDAGAGLVAVTLIVLVPNVSSSVLPVAAFGGAMLVALMIYWLAWRDGDSPIRLILVGIGLAAVLGTLTTLIITFGNIYSVQAAMVWLSGSVYGTTWDELWALLPWVAVFAPLTLLLARDLNALNLGDDVARGLGAAVERRRGLLLIAAVALAGSTVAAAGSIAFVGLMAPHLARRLVGPDHSGLLPIACVIGSLLVVSVVPGGPDPRRPS